MLGRISSKCRGLFGEQNGDIKCSQSRPGGHTAPDLQRYTYTNVHVHLRRGVKRAISLLILRPLKVHKNEFDRVEEALPSMTSRKEVGVHISSANPKHRSACPRKNSYPPPKSRYRGRAHGGTAVRLDVTSRRMDMNTPQTTDKSRGLAQCKKVYTHLMTPRPPPTPLKYLALIHFRGLMVNLRSV